MHDDARLLYVPEHVLPLRSTRTRISTPNAMNSDAAAALTILNLLKEDLQDAKTQDPAASNLFEVAIFRGSRNLEPNATPPSEITSCLGQVQRS